MQDRIADAQQHIEGLREEVDRLTKELIDFESTKSGLHSGPINQAMEGRRRNTMEVFEQAMQKTAREEMLETAVSFSYYCCYCSYVLRLVNVTEICVRCRL